MNKEIRHRRLYAFYNSKVLNVLMIVVITGLLAIPSAKTLLLPVIASALALVLFISYSLWIWIWKPESIVINKFLSDVNGLYTLYFLVIAAFKNVYEWLYYLPIFCIVVILFVVLIKNYDQTFDINS